MSHKGLLKLGTVITVLLLSNCLLPPSFSSMGKWEQVGSGLCALPQWAVVGFWEWILCKASAQANWDWSHLLALGKDIPSCWEYDWETTQLCRTVWGFLVAIYVYMQTHIQIYINIHTHRYACIGCEYFWNISQEITVIAFERELATTGVTFR